MKLTTKQKIYAGMLVLAGTAFTADRSLFTPAGAQAMPMASVAVGKSAPVAAVAVAAPANTAADLSALAQRLDHAAATFDPAKTRDAFQPSQRWIELSAAKAKQSAPSAIDGFRNKHKLLAVMTGARGGLAIVDGKTVRSGQTIDGFRLTSVREQSATFESPDGAVELQIQNARPANATITGNTVVSQANVISGWGN